MAVAAGMGVAVALAMPVVVTGWRGGGWWAESLMVQACRGSFNFNGIVVADAGRTCRREGLCQPASQSVLMDWQAKKRFFTE